VLANQFPVLSWERDWFRHALEEIRASLGDQSYELAVARGAALSYDDAVAVTSSAIEDRSRAWT
jgi:hypothetical protein